MKDNQPAASLLLIQSCCLNPLNGSIESILKSKNAQFKLSFVISVAGRRLDRAIASSDPRSFPVRISIQIGVPSNAPLRSSLLMVAGSCSINKTNPSWPTPKSQHLHGVTSRQKVQLKPRSRILVDDRYWANAIFPFGSSFVSINQNQPQQRNKRTVQFERANVGFGKIPSKFPGATRYNNIVCNQQPP